MPQGRGEADLGTKTMTANSGAYVVTSVESRKLLDLAPPYVLQLKTEDAGATPPDTGLAFDCKLQHAVADVAALYEDASIAVTQITAAGTKASSGSHSTLGTPLRKYVRAVVQGVATNWNNGTKFTVTLIGNYNA